MSTLRRPGRAPQQVIRLEFVNTPAQGLTDAASQIAATKPAVEKRKARF